MAIQTFTLLDEHDAPVPAAAPDARQTGITLRDSADWSVRLRTLRCGLSDGVQVVELCSGLLTVHLLPTRGMGIWKAECGGVVAGWQSPVRRPVHPRHVELGARNGLGWLDGFNELLCRCGLAFNGPPGIDAGAKSPIESQLSLHGKIANLPAHRVKVLVDDSGPGRISVVGEVDECTLFGPQLRLTSTTSVIAGSTTIEIEDRVENLASTPTELELLYHINVGPPFLEAGARFSAPAAVVAPRDDRAAEGIDGFETYLGPTPGYAEQAYFFDLAADAQSQTETLLHNAGGDRGLGVRFDRRGLPCFTQWKCTQPEVDGYVTGLEPGTNFPNFKSFEREQGRVISLAAGATHVARLVIDLHLTGDAVSASQARIAAMRSGEPTIYRQPTAGFSPVT